VAAAALIGMAVARAVRHRIAAAMVALLAGGAAGVLLSALAGLLGTRRILHTRRHWPCAKPEPGATAHRRVPPSTARLRLSSLALQRATKRTRACNTANGHGSAADWH
jgi:hypothetical protein